MNQVKIVNEWINTSNYVYNKTIDQINNKKHPANFKSLRDLLVTQNTKKNNIEYKDLSEQCMILHREKFNSELTEEQVEEIKLQIINLNLEIRETSKTLESEKNINIKDWELNTPKDIRAEAVNDACKAYKTGMSNFKAGNIQHFKLGFRKKNNPNQCIVIAKNSKIEIKNGKLSFYPRSFDKQERYFKLGKMNKKYNNLEISSDCRIIKTKNKYWLCVPIEEKIKDKIKPINYCGTDMGIKTFATTFGNNGCLEYKHDNVMKKLDKLNNKIDMLKNYRMLRPRKNTNKRIRKRIFNKYENKKINIVNELHWKTINHMIEHNDVIMHGDIKSHDIVSNGIKYGYKKKLNRQFNDLKFYTFKLRLEYKAEIANKKVFCVNESYTTQTCSFCGNMYKPGVSRIYKCKNCNRNIGRDVNAAKNILMKGITLNM